MIWQDGRKKFLIGLVSTVIMSIMLLLQKDVSVLLTVFPLHSLLNISTVMGSALNKITYYSSSPFKGKKFDSPLFTVL